MRAKTHDDDGDDALTLRLGRPDEAEAIGTTAYRGFRWGTAESWTKYFVENPHGGPKNTLVVERVRDGALLGTAAGLELTIALAGRDVPMRGFAAVAVPPEYRRRGIAERLVHGWLSRMKRRGEALAGLYPFRTQFYRKSGFGVVEWLDRVETSPGAFPASSLRSRVRAMEPGDASAVRALYEASRAGATLPLARSDYWWSVRVARRGPEGAVYTDARGRVTGYALYEVPSTPGYPEQELHVRELVASEPDATRGLHGFVEALGEQYAKVSLLVPRGNMLALLAGHGRDDGAGHDTYKVCATTLAGMMLRLVDIAAAFALHPGPAQSGVRARVGIELDDPVIASQRGSFDVTLGPRGASFVRGRAARERLSLSVDQLAQVYAGAARAEAMRASGQCEGSVRAAQALDAAFAGPAPFLGRLNAF